MFEPKVYSIGGPFGVSERLLSTCRLFIVFQEVAGILREVLLDWESFFDVLID